VKRQWTPEELIAHWTLLPRDLALLANKHGPTRLGFAALLLAFQQEGRFPRHRHEIPRVVIAHVAAQVGVATADWLQYDWTGRAIKYHRAQIRAALGYRAATVPDADALIAWLCDHVVPDEQQEGAVIAVAYQRLQTLKIEPPTAERMERIARSALHTYEMNLQQQVLARLSPAHRAALDALLATEDDPETAGIESHGESTAATPVTFLALKADPGRVGLDSLLREVAKLQRLCALALPDDLFTGVSPKLVRAYYARIATESTHEVRRHPLPVRATLVAAFCHVRQQEIIDGLVDLLIQLVRKIGIKAEKKVEQILFADFKRVRGKPQLLYHVAAVSLEHPTDRVCDVIYPAVGGEQTLHDLVRESTSTDRTYRSQVHTVMRASYSHHYRRMLPVLLQALQFHSTNATHRPVIDALRLLREYTGRRTAWYDGTEPIPLDGVIPASWRSTLVERDKEGNARVNRITYEILVLQALRDKLRCKEIWVQGANRYRNPDDDLPTDFEAARETYYAALRQPRDADVFIADVQAAMQAALRTFHDGLPKNLAVRILAKKGGWIALTPLDAQPEPVNLERLKGEVTRHWPMTSLLDFLKEAELRIGFTAEFTSAGARETLERDTLQRRLLLCLYGLGTNTGLKRMAADAQDDSYGDLLYVRRRFVHREQLRHAIARVVNAIFAVRHAQIWGEGTTACASDAKKFGAWDQNLMTEWSIRHHGRGVMIYWHVEKHATCIYSQLKTVSSSEVAAMIEGVLRHCTAMEVEKNYVDSHGQSEVAFAFTHLLGFQLMPRLKGLHAQKLYVPFAVEKDAYPLLQPVLARPINWALIRQQYDQMIKYATALRLGTAETEAILRRFTRAGVQHPTYAALAELGKAIKTIFLCSYLHNEAIRREVQDGLQVVENWNSANSFIFYGKSGEIATNRRDDQEVSVLCLHLLQICLVYINTLMIQQVLGQTGWDGRLLPEDLRALTPLIYAHVTPYGHFRLDLTERLPLAPVGAAMEAVG
jgi:TnpA family transposase